MTIERDIGRLEAEVKALHRTVARMEPQLETAVTFITATRASRRTLIAISTAAGSVGAAIVTAAVAVFQHLKP